MSEWVGGIHAALSVLESAPETVRSAFVQQGREEARLSHVLALLDENNISIQVMNRRDLDRKAQPHTRRHQGILLEVAEWKGPDESELKSLILDRQDFFALVLDGVTDVHNLGACMRSAWAAGCNAIIMPKDKSAPVNATVRKVAVGAVDHVPVFRVTNLSRTLELLKQEGVWITGTAGETEQLYWDVDYKGRCAIVMGAEDKGMRRLTREACDHLVRIPMAGEAESLNVSVAAGVVLFEASKQRCQSSN